MHKLTAAITSAVEEFSANHQSLRQLMVNTLVAIVEGKVGPLLSAAKTEADNLRFQLADELNGGLAMRAERDALAKFKAHVHKRLDDAGVPKFDDGRDCRIGSRLDWVLETFRVVGEARENVSLVEINRTVPLVGGGSTTLPVESRREVML